MANIIMWSSISLFLLASLFVKPRSPGFGERDELLDFLVRQFPELLELRKAEMSESDYIALLVQYNHLVAEEERVTDK